MQLTSDFVYKPDVNCVSRRSTTGTQQSLTSPGALFSTLIIMIFSAALIVSLLSLLSSTCALTLNAREDDCTLACPETDAVGNALSVSSIDDANMSCSYAGELTISCTYHATRADSSLVLQLGSRWLRLPVLSSVTATAALNKRLSSASPVAADNSSRRLSAGSRMTNPRKSGVPPPTLTLLGNTRVPRVCVLSELHPLPPWGSVLARSPARGPNHPHLLAHLGALLHSPQSSSHATTGVPSRIWRKVP